MKKMFSVVAITFVSLFFIGNVFACEGQGCPEPTVPDYDECVSGDCDGGFAYGSFGGDAIANAGFVSNGLWTEACGDMQAITTVGAPNRGESMLENNVTRLTSFEKLSEDGNLGSQFQEMGKINLNSKAIDGGFASGKGNIQNTSAAEVYSNKWSDSAGNGITANMNGALNMAGMLCVTDGTTGLLENEVITNTFQKMIGDHSAVFQQSQMNGLIRIEKNNN